jgi:hypothetical protein
MLMLALTSASEYELVWADTTAPPSGTSCLLVSIKVESERSFNRSIVALIAGVAASPGKAAGYMLIRC